MAKRKCEQPLLALLPPPPCKRPPSELPVSARRCAPLALHGAASKRRKAELSPPAGGERAPPSGRPAASQPPSKKPRPAESPASGAAPDFQCQKDEAFQEYNSFHFWRTPLPDIDFSELDVACDRPAVPAGTDALEDMDS